MRKKKRDYDFNVNAFRIVEEATRDRKVIEVEAVNIEGKNPNAVSLGRLGGKARLTKLTPEQRKEIAKTAAKKRWHKTD